MHFASPLDEKYGLGCRACSQKKTPATGSGGEGCDFNLRGESRLEQDLQTELDLSRELAGSQAANRSESTRIKVRVRFPEVHVVEYVEELRTELEADSFAELEVLKEPKVSLE